MSPATETDLSSHLRTSVARFARRLRRERHDSGLGLGALAVLGTLDRRGPQTPGELAAHEKVQPPSMSRIIAHLESDELVRRTPHPSDGRQYLAEITPRGSALLAKDRRQKDAWLAQRLAELTADQRATLGSAAEILERLAQT